MGQSISMSEYITLKRYYDADGQHNIPLTVWITEKKTQNLLGLNFCHEQMNKKHFDLHGIELKRALNTFCNDSLELNKIHEYVSQILTIKISHSNFKLKTTECYKFDSDIARNIFLLDLWFYQTERQFRRDSTSLMSSGRTEKDFAKCHGKQQTHPTTLVKGTL